MRWILIVLVILNLAALMWFLRQAPETVPGVAVVSVDAVPPLVLLSEVRGAQAPADPLTSDTTSRVAASPPSPPQARAISGAAAPSGEKTPVEPAAGAACHELGPFPASEDVEAFTRAFGEDFVLTPERRPRQIRTNYRVYLPPYASREAAQLAFDELRNRLASSGLNFENFVITRGELTNGIALGLFSEQRNAQNVQVQLAALDYEVVIAEEPVNQDELWVRLLERNGGATLQSRWAQMQAGRPWLQGLEKLC